MTINLTSKVSVHLKHPNVVPLYGYLQNDASLPKDIVTPYIPEGTLEDCYRTHADMSAETRKGLIFDAALGLAYLHANNIVHLDVKAANILVTNVRAGSTFRLRALLSDFGLAKDPEKDKITSASLDSGGSTRWKAWELAAPSAFAERFPEIKRSERKLLQKADVWSWGMTVLEVFMGMHPYANKQGEDVGAELRNGTPPSYSRAFVKKKGMEEELRVTMKRCWARNVLSRPTMQEVIDELKIPAPDPVEEEHRASSPRSPCRQQTTDGKQVLFYARAKRRWHAKFGRGLDFKADDLLHFCAGDIIAVTKDSPDGWLVGQRFTRMEDPKPLFTAVHVCDANPTTTKLHRTQLPFVATMRYMYRSTRRHINVQEGDTVLITGKPNGDADTEKLTGCQLKPDSTGIFPAHRARKIVGPRKTWLPHGVLYYMEATHDFEGETRHIDVNTELRFKVGDIIAVTDAPAEGPWTGELIGPRHPQQRPYGTFERDAVESEYLDS
ncbi:kinase-like protein [Punctularia strigosozonata HHB-11173 SS5]|uniref:kinase-like protein n=1 Tax=Punctularia strigosozonata (strain HHB-11173) TaxID=741275 RepID=UPI0004417A10|nr:kinase-like protein [Punctularia strigosozonata HHB-11173 SS5]EIN06252.1 kinase-like protein [Punctularia strigosozonata HHB-11173 SS5]